MFLKNQVQYFLIFIDCQTKIYHNQHMRYSDIIQENTQQEPRLRAIALLATKEEGQMIWTEVQPSMSGIIFTFWVSYEPDYPFIIIDPVPGGRIVPTDKCQAFDYWKKTPYPEIDSWMKKNRKAVMDLLRQKIDSVDFYNRVNNTLLESLMEMANLQPARTGVDRIIYCSQKQHSADVRIKVALGKSITGGTVTIAVREDRVIGTGIPEKELDQIRKWIILNSDTLIKFWNGEIQTTADLLSKIQSISGNEDNIKLSWEDYLAGLNSEKDSETI